MDSEDCEVFEVPVLPCPQVGEGPNAIYTSEIPEIEKEDFAGQIG